MQLLPGRDGIRRTMQIQSIFAQRFAMVRYIQHCRIALGLRLQQVDQMRQHAIGIQDRIVVGIRDLSLRAAAQLRGFADGCPALECGRVALEIIRPVVAEHVQDDQAIAGHRLDLVRKASQQDLVEAASAGAQLRGVL